MTKSARIAAASLLILSLTTTATAQMVYDGVIFDFTESGQGLWELVPTVIRDGTNNHMLLAVQKSRAEPRDIIRKLTTTGNLRTAVWNPATSQLVFDRDKMYGFFHNAHHVGDPTVLAFNDFYGPTFYKWRMFFTYDDKTSPCHDAICNEIGMTFSNDLVNWTVSPAASFVPDVLPKEYSIAPTLPDWTSTTPSPAADGMSPSAPALTRCTSFVRRPTAQYSRWNGTSSGSWIPR